MSPLDRRTFLKLGTGAAALSAARPQSLWSAQDQPRRVKGVIWLWMDGGMNQFQTWDPKPALKKAGVTAIDTTVPGIQVSELLPICASQMKHLAIIRSMSHGLGDHDSATYLMHAGAGPRFGQDLPALGTILACELGPKEFPLPKFISVGQQQIPRSAAFDEEFNLFLARNVDNPIPNIRRNVDASRDHERAALLLEQNQEWSSTRLQAEAARITEGMAASELLINTPLLKAFNAWDETEPLRKEYGEGFGQACLVARRLVQTGCPFVEIGLGDWAARKNPWIPSKILAATLDRGLGTLIKDLAARDLLKDVLVVCATEFGKEPAPRGNPWDFWTRGFSVVLAGGLIPGGVVHGDTGPDGQACAAPVSVIDLFATIYKACGVDPAKEYVHQGLPKKYLAEGKPVDDLF